MNSMNLQVETVQEVAGTSKLFALRLEDAPESFLRSFPVLNGLEGYSALEEPTEGEEMMLGILKLLPCVREAVVVEQNLLYIEKAHECDWEEAERVIHSTLSGMFTLHAA